MSHLIQRQVLDVSLLSKNKANEQQEAIRQLYWERIVPALDEAFSKIVPDDVTLRIDELRIDVGAVSLDKLVTEIVQQVSAQLKDIFFKAQYEHQQQTMLPSSQTVEKEATIIIQSESYSKALIFFLAHGLFPWWFKPDQQISPNALLEKTIKEQPEILLHFLQNQAETQVQKRLEIQFSEIQLLQLLEIEHTQPAAILSQVLDACWQLDVSNFCDKSQWEKAIQFSIKKTVAWLLTNSPLASISSTELGGILLVRISKELQKPVKAILSFMAKEVVKKQNPVFDILKKTFELEKKVHPFPGSKERKILEKKKEKSEDIPTIQNKFELPEGFSFSGGEEKLPTVSQEHLKKENTKIVQTELEKGIYISNAGLVLLAPFMSSYFEGVDLLENQYFISVEARERALLLTQFLIAAQTAISEHELLLNKIITGWPLADPVTATIIRTAKEEKESSDLLQAVIKHWGALGNSGIAALQETFLQREGKLISKDDHYKLIVERKTVDILMDKIPWSFSIIKLPWMEKRIQVEW